MEGKNNEKGRNYRQHEKLQPTLKGNNSHEINVNKQDNTSTKVRGQNQKEGKGKANDEGEGSSDLPPPKMKPLQKMNKWFEFEGDFRWGMMVGLRGLWRLHWAPIIEDLVYDFLHKVKSR